VQKRYDEQQSRFQAPERVRAAYVELALEALPAAEQPSADVLRVIYESDKAGRFTSPEERRARHILIRFGADKDAAQKRAQKLAARARGGVDFGPLAASESDDPGSKQKGGDLGWVRRGQMLQKFEEALFAMKRGEVSEPVETEFGWHVIKLDDIREAKVPSFDEVKDQFRQRAQQQQIQKLVMDLRQKAKIEER
jgi:peptidyl-prolyl cis-trans isomerase D